jgi:ATP-dependent Clp protease protease subunit
MAKNPKKNDLNEDVNEFMEDLLDAVFEVDKDTKVQDLLDILTFKNRTIILQDIKGNVTGSNIYQNILIWNIIDKNTPINKREPIKIYIDSWGGSIIDGFEIIDAIKASKTPVHTYVTGAAYSCGLMVALAGHKRFAYPHSSFLFHEGSIGSEMQDAHKFKKYAEFYNTQLEQMKEFILERTNITEEEYEKINKDDNWYTTEQALEKGFIDEVIK